MYIANLRLPTEKAYGIQIAKMCEAFAEQGVRVGLVMPTRRNPVTKNLFDYYPVKKNFQVIKLWSPDFYLPGTLDRIAVSVKDVISAIRLAFFAAFQREEIVYSRDELPLYLLSFFRGDLVFEAHRYSSHRVWLYRRFRKAGVRVVVISTSIREKFLRLGFAEGQILLAPDGVDLAQFDIQGTKEECRTALSLPHDKVLALYTGHLYPWKGVGVLAEASKQLDQRYVVVIVGGTEHEVARYKNEYVDDAHIMFLGWRPHRLMPLYLRAADMLVLPNSGKEDISRIYTSPLKMFEYMASGKPIIASDLPSIREVLSDETAFFTPPDNPTMLAQAIHMVASDIPESEKRAQQARIKVAGYSWLSRARHILRFIAGMS